MLHLVYKGLKDLVLYFLSSHIFLSIKFDHTCYRYMFVERVSKTHLTALQLWLKMAIFFKLHVKHFR